MSLSFNIPYEELGGVGLTELGMDRAAYVCQKRKIPYTCGSALGQSVRSNDDRDYCRQAGYDSSTTDLYGSLQKRSCTADSLTPFSITRRNTGAQGWPASYHGLEDKFSRPRYSSFLSTPIALNSDATPQSLYECQPFASSTPVVLVDGNYSMYAEVEMGRVRPVSPQTTATIFTNRNSTLDESSSRYGSYDLSRTQSQHGTPETLLEIPDQFSYDSGYEADIAFSSIEDTEILHGRTNVPDPFTEQLSGEADEQFTGNFVCDEPWSPVKSQRTSNRLYQRPSIHSGPPKEMPSYSSDSISQRRANSTTCHLSDISSEQSNGSWPSLSRAAVDASVELRSKFPSNSGEALVDTSLISPTNHNFPDAHMQYPQHEWDNLITPYNLNDLSQPLDSPWNHIDVTCQFDSSLKGSLFADGTGFGDDECSTEIVCENSIPLLDNQDGGPVLGTNPRRNSSHSTWENIIFPPGYTQQLGAKKVEKDGKQKVGRRRGPLGLESAKKAQVVRRLRACWQCWLFKVTCSPGDECERCKNSSSPLAFRICNRARLADYTEVFFPAIIASRREISTVNDNIKAFLDNKVKVQLSSGPWYPPITVLVHEFIPKIEEELAMNYVSPYVDTPSSRLERRYTPPLAILGLDTHQLKNDCREHIKQIIKQSQSPGNSKTSTTSRLCWRVYEAVNRYRKLGNMTGNVGLLRKVMMLHALHYCISRILRFTKESADTAISSIRTPMKLPYAKSMTSKVLNAQIKCVMNTLLYGITREVLEGLEKELRTRTKASWTTSFCVVSILCICIEAVQVDTDGYIVQNIVNGNARANPAMTRDAVIDVCRSLDDLPFKQCTDLFHGIYRTRKPKTGHRNERGFNPIRDGVDLDEKEGLNSATVELVDDVRKIMIDYGEEIDHKPRVPSFSYEHDLWKDHMNFRIQNPGRLLATFLRTFREEN